LALRELPSQGSLIVRALFYPQAALLPPKRTGNRRQEIKAGRRLCLRISGRKVAVHL
jgi:hypothetical protein